MFGTSAPKFPKETSTLTTCGVFKGLHVSSSAGQLTDCHVEAFPPREQLSSCLHGSWAEAALHFCVDVPAAPVMITELSEQPTVQRN